MVNTEMLRKKIEESGITITSISEKTGISRETLYNRFGTDDFKASEISVLTKVLNLSKKDRDDIFFGN